MQQLLPLTGADLAFSLEPPEENIRTNYHIKGRALQLAPEGEQSSKVPGGTRPEQLWVGSWVGETKADRHVETETHLQRSLWGGGGRAPTYPQPVASCGTCAWQS